MEGTLVGALGRARARGELSADKGPAGPARFLAAFVQGLRVMGNVHAGRAFLESAVSSALVVLN
ncbi:hypothetical protein [Streptomyces sp. NBC_00271]|uniref:hypothetical protein n=1 Tax=Streptomyces sp. NBC_00271 TaxID=2975697 RepID=UPI002E29CF0C|nr:hypothetical protein [Streptomyces sp. NBC_00271]